MPIRKNVCMIHRIYCPPNYTSCPIGGCTLTLQADVDLDFQPYGTQFGNCNNPETDSVDNHPDSFWDSSDSFNSRSSPFDSSPAFFDDGSDPFSDCSDNFSNQDINDTVLGSTSDCSRSHSYGSKRFNETKLQVRHVQISGIVHNLRSSYTPRWGIRKVWDLMAYRARPSNLVHRFTVSSDDQGRQYDVICYGEIRLESGQLVENSYVTVIGKMNRDSVIVGRRIWVNNIPVRFRQESSENLQGRMPVWIASLLRFIVLLTVMILAMMHSPLLKEFVTLWIFFSILLEIGLLALARKIWFVRKIASNPVIAMIIGGIMTFLAYNYNQIDQMSGGVLAELTALTMVLIILGLILFN